MYILIFFFFFFRYYLFQILLLLLLQSTLLLRAAKAGKHFEIIVLEGRPDAGGAKAAQIFVDAGIPTTVVLDSSMGYVMERVDMVLVGAEGTNN